MKKLFLLLAVVALGFTACDKENNQPDSNKIAVTSIRVATNSVVSLNVGEQYLSIVEVFPADATDLSVTWKSSNEAIAKVVPYKQQDNASAVYIEGVGAGHAIVTATTNDGGYSAEINVTVH